MKKIFLAIAVCSVLASGASFACDVEAAKSSASDASDYARKAKTAADDSYSSTDESSKSSYADDATRYARNAQNAADDAVSYLSDCQPQQYAQSAHHYRKDHAEFKQLSAEAEATINGTVRDGAEFLIGQGWKANNGKWHKQGYTLTLVVENGIVLNAQLSK